MTPTQRTAALRLAATLDSRMSADPEGDEEAAALLRELAAEPVQKPVAWLVTSSSGPVFAAAWKQGAHEHINDMLMRDEIDDLDEVKSWRVVPVYAAPQQRKPLTDEQILTAAGRLPGWLRHHEELDCDDLIDFARAIEKAHGIGEEA